MKQANQLLFLVIGIPMGLIIWFAMVGAEAGTLTVVFAAVSLGLVAMMKSRLSREKK